MSQKKWNFKLCNAVALSVGSILVLMPSKAFACIFVDDGITLSGPCYLNGTANGAVVDTSLDALMDIVDDAILADVALAKGTPQAPFGVFASGQLAHTEHDGFKISRGPSLTTGPDFDVDEFSAAVSVDFNAAKHFGLDNELGLNLGLFGGFASAKVNADAFGFFPPSGEATNRSGMFGGYGLYRRGTSYLLVAASAFLGNTDVESTGFSSGSYGTQGYAMTGSVGRIFNLTDRVRFDLRGGLLGVTFTGDEYADTLGNPYGKSRLSFGAIKFEPGIYADYQLGNGMVISPYARADLQQRFGYSNTASVFGVESNFEDADFSTALSAGFNLKMSPSTTVSSEIRGKWSQDSSTVSGKLGLKVAF